MGDLLSTSMSDSLFIQEILMEDNREKCQ